MSPTLEALIKAMQSEVLKQTTSERYDLTEVVDGWRVRVEGQLDLEQVARKALRMIAHPSQHLVDHGASMKVDVCDWWKSMIEEILQERL